MRSFKLAATAVALNAALSPLMLAVAAPKYRTFTVADDVHTLNEATFTSRAAIVRMIGRTNKATGEAQIDANDLKASKGTIKLNVASFDTGIGKRNEHMRGFIEAEKYPDAVLTFTSVTAPGNRLKVKNTVSGTATGTMTFHGVTRPVQVPVDLTWLPQEDPKYRPGDWIQVHSQFRLKLSDYKIDLPTALLGIKVADEIAIEIDGMAKGH